MGMDQRVSFSPEKKPSWQAIAAALATRNLAVQMRMIDGQLAFPDEEPPDSWREIRVGTAAGMITLRREDSAIAIVAWGNASEELKRDWQTLAQAIADAAGGHLETMASRAP